MAQQDLIQARWTLVKEKVQTVVDSVVEYPGSEKGDHGRWVPTEWFAAKIDQLASKNGRKEGGG